MNSIQIRKTKSLFVIITIVALGWVTLFGISFGMEMRSDGTMMDCLFSRYQVICPMSIFEHISLWNNMFAANAVKTMVIFFMVMVLAATVYLFELEKFSKMLNYQKLYLQQKPYLLYFDYLKEAFSQGILKPKIYKSSI